MSPRRPADSRAPRVLPFDSRRRIAAALERCTRSERQLLALMLCERLSAPEAAGVLGLPAREVERVFAGLLRDLDVALSNGAARRSRRPRLEDADLPLRKAS
jgi:DNA-directed RNA polymerase specialized sigma24 family protein